MRKIAVFGSTGSIGTQALNIIRSKKDRLKAEVLTAGSNLSLISEQIKEFEPLYAVLPDNDSARDLAKEYAGVQFFFGDEGLAQVAKNCEYDYMLNSLLGISGFIPTYNCLSSGRSVALANKETLVAGGSIIMNLAREKKCDVIPVDSEHSAIFQCLQGLEAEDDDVKSRIKNITLTASGGAFRGKTIDELKNVTKDDALKHPNWSMGNKITIDSATLMNKGFEVIEAKWLFDLSPEQINVVLHPESIIHSMVEFVDNSTLAQLGQPDMAVPISYAFSYPDRWETNAKPIDLIEMGRLNFTKPDMETFKCLGLAIRAMKEEDSSTVVLNAANEVLVQLFLEGKIGFLDIGDTVEYMLDNHEGSLPKTPEEVLEIDKETRIKTLEYKNKR